MSQPDELGEPDLKIAGFELWVHGRQFPDAHDYDDGNWLVVTAHGAAHRRTVEWYRCRRVPDAVRHMAAGMAAEAVADEFGVTREDVLAALSYAAQLVASKRIRAT